MAVSELILLSIVSVGALLMIMEAVAPGSDLVVVGFSLFVTGVFGWLVPGVTLPILIVVFILVSLASYYLYENYFVLEISGDDTSDSSDLMYSSGTAIEDINSNSGKIRLDEGVGMTDEYQARSEYGKIEKGSRVVVTDPGGGSVLNVIPESEKDVSMEKSLQK